MSCMHRIEHAKLQYITSNEVIMSRTKKPTLLTTIHIRKRQNSSIKRDSPYRQGAKTDPSVGHAILLTMFMV